MLSCRESALAEENGCRLKPPLLNTSFLFDLGIAVAAALLFSLLFYKLRLPMIVAKLVADRTRDHGENLAATIMMVMVVEDLIAIFLLFLTPELAGGNQVQVSAFLIVTGKAGFLFLATFGFSRYIGPRIINRISQYELEVGEISFLLALSFGFLFGVLSDYLGFSPGIGALLTGFFLPVKHSRYVR